MKTIFFIPIVFLSLQLFAQQPPEGFKCYGYGKENWDFQRPEKGPIIKDYRWCHRPYNESSRSWGGDHSRYFEVFVTNLDQELPSKTKHKIDKIFVKKIIELKGKDEFYPIITFLTKFATKAKHPKEYSILAAVGLVNERIDASVEVKTILKATLIDAVLLHFVSGNRKNKYHTDALIYYGLHKGVEFGVINENMDIHRATKNLMRALEENENYNDRYKAFETILNRMEITLF